MLQLIMFLILFNSITEPIRIHFSLDRLDSMLFVVNNHHVSNERCLFFFCEPMCIWVEKRINTTLYNSKFDRIGDGLYGIDRQRSVFSFWFQIPLWIQKSPF